MRISYNSSLLTAMSRRALTHTRLYHGHWLASQVWWQLGQDVTAGHTRACILVHFFFLHFLQFSSAPEKCCKEKNSYSEKNDISRRFDDCKLERFSEKKRNEKHKWFHNFILPFMRRLSYIYDDNILLNNLCGFYSFILFYMSHIALHVL